MALFLVTGASGAGKTSIVHTLKQVETWKECISHTTRPMRKGEVEGSTYYYVNDVEFDSMALKGKFAEVVDYAGYHYGVSKAEIERVSKSGKHAVIIVEYNGYKQLKKIYPDAVGIFIYMNKENCLANMLLRGDTIEKSLERIEKYDEEMKNRNDFDYVVKNVNGHLVDTVQIITNIIKQYN